MRKSAETYEKKALKALYDLSQATMSAGTLEEVFAKILEKAMKIIGVEKASIMRYDPQDKYLKIIAGCGIPKNIIEGVRVRSGEGISGKVFANEKPLLVSDVGKQKDALKNKRYRSKSLISAPVTCFPLKVRGKSVGVINMTDKKNGQPFTKADLELLTTISAQAAAFIRIYDLVSDLKETEDVRRELDMAREIQESLLPGKLPALNGVEAAGCLLIAERLGGDYYDVLSSGWSHPAFVVADVSGHNIGAALLMSAFRSALKSEAGIPVLPPATVIRRLNKAMYNDLLKAEQFISVAYLQYIHSSRTLRFSTAGHHPVWLYRPSKKEFHKLVTEGPLLGIERGEHFYEDRCDVKKGDVVVMYTDGIVEAKSVKGEMFGMGRLKKSIAKYSGRSPSKIIDALSQEVKKFAGRNLLKDDVTLLVLKFK